MPRGKEYATIEDIQEVLNQMKIELVNKIVVVVDKIDVVEKRIDASEARIQTKIDAVEKRIDASVKSTLEELGKKMNTMESDLQQVKKSCDDNLMVTLKELNEMEEKRSNIIIFGLPECLSQGGSSPRDSDASQVDGILEKVTGHKVAFDVKFRIGQKEENKTRPIVVKIRDPSSKEEILKGSTALKDHLEWKNVYIKPDLTKRQRELFKKHEEELREEAGRRNAHLKNGEDWEWGVRGRGLQRHLIKLRIRL